MEVSLPFWGRRRKTGEHPIEEWRSAKGRRLRSGKERMGKNGDKYLEIQAGQKWGIEKPSKQDGNPWFGRL
jgi:hypothetical protein